MPHLVIESDGKVYGVLHMRDATDIASEIARHGVPDGCRVVEVDSAQIPTEDPFRRAWRHCEQQGIRHCLPTARNIHRDRMREKRKLLFSEVNAAWMRAEMQGLDKAEIAEKYQKLLDVPAAPEIEQVQSIDELKELWPSEVLGETPYVAPPLPPPAKPFAFTPNGVPLWSKREYNEYMAAVEANLAAQRREEPEPVAVEDEQYPQDYPEPPPVAAPRATSGRRGDWKAAAAAVSLAEDFDAPLPEYQEPPPEPTAADVFNAFDVTREFKQAPAEEQEPARLRLRTAYSKACAALNEDRWEYDIAVMAGHGNNEQAANLDMTAKRRGVGVQDVADEIIANYRGCERALSAIREINEIALTDMVARPGDSQAIVNKAIGLINEMVGHATAYRS
jgi:hypothetical protein